MFKESDLRIASPVYQLLFEASQPHPAKRQLASDWITLLSFAALANLEMCKTNTSIGLPASSKLTRGDAGLVVASDKSCTHQPPTEDCSCVSTGKAVHQSSAPSAA